MMHAPTLKTVFWLIVCQLNRGIHPSQGATILAAILAVHFVPICCGTKWTAQLPSDLHCVGCKQSLHHAVHIFDINRPRRHLEVVAITSGHSWKLVVELRYPCPNPKDRQKNCECFRRQRMLRSGQGSFRDPQMDTRLSPVLFLSQRNFEHVQNFLISSMRQEKSQKLNVWRTFATQRTLTNTRFSIFDNSRNCSLGEDVRRNTHAHIRLEKKYSWKSLFFVCVCVWTWLWIAKILNWFKLHLNDMGGKIVWEINKKSE